MYTTVHPDLAADSADSTEPRAAAAAAAAARPEPAGVSLMCWGPVYVYRYGVGEHFAYGVDFG